MNEPTNESYLEAKSARDRAARAIVHFVSDNLADLGPLEAQARALLETFRRADEEAIRQLCGWVDGQERPERTDHAYNEWVRSKVEQQYPRRDECDGYADWPRP